MSKTVLFVFVVFALVAQSFACEKEEQEIGLFTSEWKLIEQLSDPGDGSGTFQKVDSDKVIQFFEDGTLRSNGSLCFMNSTTNEDFVATFNEAESLIVIEDCGSNREFRIEYGLLNGDLILSYPCIEPCAQKYERVE